MWPPRTKTRFRACIFCGGGSYGRVRGGGKTLETNTRDSCIQAFSVNGPQASLGSVWSPSRWLSPMLAHGLNPGHGDQCPCSLQALFVIPAHRKLRMENVVLFATLLWSRGHFPGLLLYPTAKWVACFSVSLPTPLPFHHWNFGTFLSPQKAGRDNPSDLEKEKVTLLCLTK